jgi:hypothetical protein
MSSIAYLLSGKHFVQLYDGIFIAVPDSGQRFPRYHYRSICPQSHAGVADIILTAAISLPLSKSAFSTKSYIINPNLTSTMAI